MHAYITEASGIPLPNVLWPSSFLAPFQEISSDRLSKNGADVNREESHFSGNWEKSKIIKEKKIGLRLGVSDERQNQVYLDPRK